MNGFLQLLSANNYLVEVDQAWKLFI